MSEYGLATSSPFLKGLNTELNKLVDSTEYTNDELNCMIRANNTRSRRPGIDYEELYKFNNEYLDLSLPDLAFQCIEWTDINSPDEAETYTGYPYLVCQVGGMIIFFRNEGQPYSGHQESFVLNLIGYALDSHSDEYMRKRCKFTAAYGCIFITSEAIKPIYLRTAQDTAEVPAPVTSYASTTFSVAFPQINTAYDSGRPTIRGTAIMKLNGVTVCTVSSPNSYVPCSTQYAAAWNAAPANTRLNITATPKYPDGVPYGGGISSATQGNITAGSGAYVPDSITFTASEPHMEGNYIEIVISYAYTTGNPYKPSSIATHLTSTSFSGTLAGGSNYTYQSQLTLAIRDTNVGANDYLGVADNPTKMSYAHLYNLLNQGWTPKLIADYYNAQSPKSFPGNNLAQQFLKDDKTSAFKPQNAINMTFGNSPAARGHEILQYFDQKRVYQSNLVSAFSQLVSSIGGVSFSNIVDTNWDLTDPSQPNETDALSQVPDVKPRKPYVIDICAYAGRIFYLTGDVLLYSQVIAEDVTKADNCYTEADPTGEEISDVIETDGGLISLPDIGEGLKLQVVGDSLLIFGTRGNMMLSGTANNIFTATAYSAGAVATVPTQAPDSFVSTEYGVFYWGITGITVLGMGDQGGIQTKDLTTDRILTWYGKLSAGQHKACKGIYSASKKKIYWFYPSDESIPRRLDMCLVYDIQRDAFCPQKLASGNGIPEVVGGVQLKVPFKSYKEYPVYAHFDEPQTDPVYLYTRVTRGTDPYIQQNFTPSADPSTDWLFVGSYTMSWDVQSDGTYDIATKIMCRNTPDPDTYITVDTLGFRTADAWDIYSPVKLRIGLGHKNLVAPNGRLIQVDTSDPYWIRYVCNNGLLTAYMIMDDGYTVETLPELSEWTGVVLHEDGYVANPGYTKLVACCHYTVDWYWKTLIDFESGNASITNVAGQQIHTYFTTPCTESTPIYSDATLATQIGTVEDLFNDGYLYRIKHCYSWIRDKIGYDKAVDEITYRRLPPLPGYSTCFMSDVNYSNRGSNELGGYMEDDTFADVDLEEYKESAGTILGWTPSAITDVSQINDAPTNLYFLTYTNKNLGDVEVTDNEGYKILADTSMDSEEFTYESSILLCLDVAECKVTFGDFRNNVIKDWAEGDWTGDGWSFDSYMISHPVNSQDFVRAKSMPYLISYFKRSETGALTTGEYLYPSHCQGSVRWDWRTNGDNSKWDSPNELYRPRKRTILSEGYIITKTNIRGIGRAFQIKLQSVEDHNFIVEALGFNLCKDERI